MRPPVFLSPEGRVMVARGETPGGRWRRAVASHPGDPPTPPGVSPLATITRPSGTKTTSRPPLAGSLLHLDCLQLLDGRLGGGQLGGRGVEGGLRGADRRVRLVDGRLRRGDRVRR